jgi:hypothetical protein
MKDQDLEIEKRLYEDAIIKGSPESIDALIRWKFLKSFETCASALTTIASSYRGWVRYKT